MASTCLRQPALQFGISGVTGIRNSRTRGSLSGSNLRSISMNLRTRGIFLGSNMQSVSMKQNCWFKNIPDRVIKRDYELPCKGLRSRNSGSSVDTDFVVTTLNLARSVESWQRTTFMVKVGSAIGLIIFLIRGLDPVVRLSRSMCGNNIHSKFSQQENDTVEQDNTYNGEIGLLRTFMFWVLVFLASSALNPMVPATETGKIVKILLKSVERASVGLTLDCWLSRNLISIFESPNDAVDTRDMGVSFVKNIGSNIVYTAVILALDELFGLVTKDVDIATFLVTSLFVCGMRMAWPKPLSSLFRVVNEKIKTKRGGYEAFETTEHSGTTPLETSSLVSTSSTPTGFST